MPVQTALSDHKKTKTHESPPPHRRVLMYLSDRGRQLCESFQYHSKTVKRVAVALLWQNLDGRSLFGKDEKPRSMFPEPT